MPRTVEVTELALRDGHQSLLATRMALEDMKRRGAKRAVRKVVRRARVKKRVTRRRVRRAVRRVVRRKRVTRRRVRRVVRRKVRRAIRKAT